MTEIFVMLPANNKYLTNYLLTAVIGMYFKKQIFMKIHFFKYTIGSIKKIALKEGDLNSYL